VNDGQGPSTLTTSVFLSFYENPHVVRYSQYIVSSAAGALSRFSISKSTSRIPLPVRFDSGSHKASFTVSPAALPPFSSSLCSPASSTISSTLVALFIQALFVSSSIFPHSASPSLTSLIPSRCVGRSLLHSLVPAEQRARLDEFIVALILDKDRVVAPTIAYCIYVFFGGTLFVGYLVDGVPCSGWTGIAARMGDAVLGSPAASCWPCDSRAQSRRA